MCQQATKRFRLVEVKTDNVGMQEIPLEDDNTLNEAKRITGIETYRVGKVSHTPTTNREIVSDVVFNKAFLTLATKGTDEVQYRIPLTDLCRADNNGQLYLVDIPPLALTKCKITVGNNGVGLDATESFLIGFHYES